MQLNEYFVEPPPDWLFRPHGRVVALVDDDRSLAAALEELASDQVPRDDVYVLGGADGLEHIDPSGRHHGWRGRISRVIDIVASEGDDIEDDCRHVEAGGYLVAVRATRDERTPIVETLRAHGAHSIRYFGPLTTLDLSN
ncbi:MAG TPA: hypothetical protein VGN59_10420 [Acidimicrobiia bacterium]|jgi:hypothetical protein